jgi:hypothetical protein
MIDPQLMTVRYVNYDVETFRPISQGTCQLRDFDATKALSPEGLDSIIVNQNEALDLTPYDHVFGQCKHAVDGKCPNIGFGAAAIATANGKTADDAILTIEELPIDWAIKLYKTPVTTGATVSASLTIS